MTKLLYLQFGYSVAAKAEAAKVTSTMVRAARAVAELSASVFFIALVGTK